MSEWIEWKWTPEKSYPETLETVVHVRMEGDEQDFIGEAWPVKEWFWKPYAGIIAYKLAD